MEDVDVFFDDLTISHTGINIIQSTDYYPYGLVMRDPDSYRDKNESYRFGYQGQYSEMDSTTGWNHFELRQYDSKIGRWLVVDPARQYYSPYIGMGNNPVYYVDPDGGCAVGDIPCIQAAQAAGFTSHSDINAFLNADILVTASRPSNISLFDGFIAALYRSEAWVNSFSGPDNFWDGKHGIEFYSSTDLNGNPSYWLRNGKAEYAIEDAGNGLVAFKGGKGGMYKLDLRTPNGSGNMNTIKQVSAIIGHGAKAIEILTNVIEQASSVHGGADKHIPVPPDSIWHKFWIQNGVNGPLEKDSVKVPNHEN